MVPLPRKKKTGTVPVYLNVYDLTTINGYAYWVGLGIYHSGVQGLNYFSFIFLWFLQLGASISVPISLLLCFSFVFFFNDNSYLRSASGASLFQCLDWGKLKGNSIFILRIINCCFPLCPVYLLFYGLGQKIFRLVGT